MKRKVIMTKITVGVISTMLSASMLMGCSGQSSTEEEVTVVEESVAEAPGDEEGTKEEAPTEKGAESEQQTPPAEELTDALMGEISAIDGDTLTVGLYEVPDKQNRPEGEAPNSEIPEGKAPDGEMPTGEMPEGKAPGGEMPTGEKAPDGDNPKDDKAGGKPQGDRTVNGGMPEAVFTLSGETFTLNITDTTVITSKNGDSEEAISAADLAEGDQITFTVDGNDALTILLMSANS